MTATSVLIKNSNNPCSRRIDLVRIRGRKDFYECDGQEALLVLELQKAVSQKYVKAVLAKKVRQHLIANVLTTL